MPPNPFEKIEDRLKKSEKVTEQDIESTFKDALDALASVNRTYDALGAKADDPKRKEFLDNHAALKEQMLKEKNDLPKAYREGRLNKFEPTIKTYAEVFSPDETAHHKKFLGSRQSAHTSTAPNDNFIPDYEGSSMSGDGLKDENANNKTRWTLSGYLTALQLVDKAKADEEMKRAKEIYDKSDEGFWNVGKAFEYKHLQDDMGLSKYMGPIESKASAQGFELGAESMGLLCGYLKMADTINPANPAESEKYGQYLYNMLESLKSRLKYEPKGEAGYELDFKRSEAQMLVLMALKNPKEWMEEISEDNKKVDELRKDFEAMKKDAMAIGGGLKFAYEDKGVLELLGKEPAAISAKDEPAIKTAKETIRAEAFAEIEKSYKKIYPAVGALQTRIGEIETKNSAAKALAEQEVGDVKTRAVAAKEKYDSIELSKDDTLPVLAQISGILVDVAGEDEVLKKKMDGMEETLKNAPGGAGGGKGGETPGTSGPDRYLDEWSKGEIVKSRFTTRNLRVAPSVTDTPFRDDNGKILGKIPGGTVVPIPEMPARARKVGDVVFVKVAYTIPYEKPGVIGGMLAGVWVDEGMLEATDAGAGAPGDSVEKTSESAEISEFLAAKNLKEVPSGNAVWYQLGDPKDVPLSPESQVMSSGNHEVDSLFLQNFVFKKMSAEESAKVNKLFQEARYASQFSAVGGAKSLAEIKGMYETYFARVWEYAGKNGRVPGSFGEIGIAGGAAPGSLPGAGASGGAGGGASSWAGETLGSAYRGEVPAALAEFARAYAVNAESREALVRMARDGEKPEGAMFDIQFNNRQVPCRLTKMGPENYVINWNTGSWAYRSLKEAMVAINEGQLIQSMTYSALRSPAQYKKYENWSGKLQKESIGGTAVPGETQFELDWEGTRRARGNPVVTVMTYPYGGIAYRIFRHEAGLRGEKYRDGFAANFDDLMRQLGHIRRWAQEEDFEKGELAYAKEYNFSILSDPRNYYAAEAMIGRPVYFGISSRGGVAEDVRGRDSEAANAAYGNEVAQLRLDWGGSGPADRQNNPLVNMWVNETGTLSYTVECPARGINTGERRVISMAEIFRDLAEMRKAGGAV